MTDNKPVDTVSIHPITAAIWLNLTKEGGKPFFSVTFSRSYKDERGEWKNSDSFGGVDLLILSKLANKAHDRVEELRKVGGQADEGSA